MICANCKHWEMGDIWETSYSKDHGVVVECKGWCLAKSSNKRKRWNYHPICSLFEKRKNTGFIIFGTGFPTKEQLETIANFFKENNDTRTKTVTT